LRKRLIDNDELLVHPIDKEDNYVKRCVAIAGDEFQIVNNQLKVNGKPAYEPKELQFSYFLNQVGNTDELGAMGIEAYPTQDGTIAMLSKREVDLLIKRGINCFPLTDSLRANAPIQPKDFALFPHQPKNFHWTRDNYGPVRVPKKGATVQLTVDTLPLYERIIRVYEGNTLEVKNGVILINGQAATSYTFKKDYYFMMGDNRHNSLDSRYWGFVPETHIVGKPVFIWNSRSQYTGFRTERMMTLVNKEGLSKSYLWFVVIGIAASVGYTQWKSRKKKAVKPGLKKSK
jgi:signal peptidase I